MTLPPTGHNLLTLPVQLLMILCCLRSPSVLDMLDHALDLGALGNYPSSPFLPSDSDILLDSPEQEDIDFVASLRFLEPSDPCLPFMCTTLEIRAILLDPSCSGSGIAIEILDHLLPSYSTAAWSLALNALEGKFLQSERDGKCLGCVGIENFLILVQMVTMKGTL
ncbi:uncharacterized protein LOC132311670 isoform X2 [Cornus florida]|uniref:uncharacterized protein LOC132311670 isoform X2 n=1 Tax=Cornus florida TaxID=4283 RepID=UPI00289E06B5|nr:uncharacterized protein LOC132311670 isoform X2 [Cornus florida]